MILEPHKKISLRITPKDLKRVGPQYPLNWLVINGVIKRSQNSKMSLGCVYIKFLMSSPKHNLKGYEGGVISTPPHNESVLVLHNYNSKTILGFQDDEPMAVTNWTVLFKLQRHL